MIRKLPHWVLIEKFPAFNDMESLTAIEQTARVYGKINELIESYNKYVTEINKAIEEYNNGTDNDIKSFVDSITCMASNYINTVDMKIAHQDRAIAEVYEKFSTDVINTLKLFISDLYSSGKLDDSIYKSLENLYFKINAFTEEQTEKTDTFIEEQTKKTEEIEGNLLNIAHPVGSIFITNTNENPGEKLGGTWELVDKEFAHYKNWTDDSEKLEDLILRIYESVNDGFGNFTTVSWLGHGVDVETVSRVYDGHNITVTIGARGKGAEINSITPLINLRAKPDMVTVPEVFNKETYWGIKYIEGRDVILPQHCVATVDNINTLSSFEISTESRGVSGGLITIYGLNEFPEDSTDGILEDGTAIHFTFTITLDKENMLDFFCDKFYWKRIS